MSKNKARRIAKKMRKYGVTDAHCTIPHNSDWLNKQNLQLLKADLIAERMLSVSPELLKTREQEYKRKQKIQELQDLQESIHLMDVELVDLTKVFCKTSGKFLFEYSNQMVQETIKIFGMEKTKGILKVKRQKENHYHPLAILNDAENLRDLAKNDPISYWIIAANKFFNSSIDDIITARAFIETIAIQDVLYCNEILRRYLGLSAAKNSRLSNEYWTVNAFGETQKARVFQNIIDPVATDLTFSEFTSQLKTELQVMIRSYCKKKRGSIINQQSLYLVDIATIKNERGGDSSRFNQKKITNATKEESILYDMLEIFDPDCEIEDDSTLAQFRYSMGARAEKRNENPAIPLHLQKKRREQEIRSESFDLEQFEAICEIAAPKEKTTNETTNETIIKTSNPFAGLFK